MGVKRVIDVDFWKDDMVAERFSAEDRYFFLYLLTNPNSKQCGIYHLPLRVIAFEMGHSKESVESIIERFEHRFKNIIYNKETQEIAILNFLKHSIIKGGKPVEDCIRKELEKVKDRSLILAVYKHMLPYIDANIEKNEKSMYKGIKNILLSFINENEIDNDNDNDNERIVPRIVEEEKEEEPTPKQVIDLYHEICTSLPKVVKLTDSRKKSINARFKEGITLEMFREVFTKAQNSSFLTGNNDRGFKADIDFLINANSLTKTLEGKYDNRVTTNIKHRDIKNDSKYKGEMF